MPLIFAMSKDQVHAPSSVARCATRSKPDVGASSPRTRPKAEIAAFEKAYPAAWTRLHALKLNTDPTDNLGPAARARLERLIHRAEQDGPAPVR
ncbi:hypothetical protein Afe04nite_21900 [Asanoa ferruginea]|nr:hypothetical protein Afe04nite_21900 [Asanoa ferruginea]